MTDGTAQPQGDRNRNERLARLRVLLPTENAIVGVDLADDKQVTVVPTTTREFWRDGA